VWLALIGEAGKVMTDLQEEWKQQSSKRVPVPQLTPFVPSSFPGGLEGTGELYAVTRAESSSHDLAISLGEEFVAMPVVFILRALIARMWDNVTFVMGALILVFCGQTLYRFPAKQQLQAFVWTEIFVGVAAVLYVFVKMERDEVLSAIQSTTPGRIHWDRDFVAKLAFYGLIPVIGLFAVEFPDIGGALLNWLQPIQKALP
jgi:hypothetical protein